MKKRTVEELEALLRSKSEKLRIANRHVKRLRSDANLDWDRWRTIGVDVHRYRNFFEVLREELGSNESIRRNEGRRRG